MTAQALPFQSTFSKIKYCITYCLLLFYSFPGRLKEKKKPVLQVTNAHSRDQSHGPVQPALAESSSARGQSRWPPESFTTLTILPFCLIILLWLQEVNKKEATLQERPWGKQEFKIISKIKSIKMICLNTTLKRKSIPKNCPGITTLSPQNSLF